MADARVVLVSGCASGIGAHLADRLQQPAERIMATDVAEDGLQDQARDRG
jgi:NADP-dependent 3-hydroxy acid dehydrogenase YdfG